MLVRNIWSLKPGECIVAEEIMERLKCEVYFPVRDVGLDLLVVKGDSMWESRLKNLVITVIT